MRKITEIQKSFGNRLDMLMNEEIINNTDLARKTGLDRNEIGKYKKGIKFPTTENLIKLADFFGVSTSYLLGETDARNADDVLIGNELGVDNLVINNIKEINKINNKYDNKYKDILGEVLTNAHLYEILLNKIDLGVQYYSNEGYKKEFDINTSIFYMKMSDYIEFNMTQEIKNYVGNYLFNKYLWINDVDENWAEVRIKGLKREIRNIKEALKRKSEENE